MVKNISLSGSIVALITPMKNDDASSIDYLALDKLLDWHIASGTNGLVVLGTTGENPTVSEIEFTEILKRVVHKLKFEKKVDLPIIAGTGTNCTETTIKKTLLAKSLGADAALVVVPYYNKPTQRGLYHHFKLVSENVEDFPLILYNVPSRTGCDMLPNTVADLSKELNIIGIKESSGKLERFQELHDLCCPGFKIISGDDNNVISAILSGYKVEGVISVTANIEPSLVKQACEAALSGNKEKAKKIDAALQPLHASLFLEPNPIPTKFLLHHMKKIQEGIRLPLLPLSNNLHERLLADYNNLKKFQV